MCLTRVTKIIENSTPIEAYKYMKKTCGKRLITLFYETPLSVGCPTEAEPNLIEELTFHPYWSGFHVYANRPWLYNSSTNITLWKVTVWGHITVGSEAGIIIYSAENIMLNERVG